MRVAGHSSIVISSMYVHPTGEAVERAFQKLETLNLCAPLQGCDPLQLSLQSLGRRPSRSSGCGT